MSDERTERERIVDRIMWCSAQRPTDSVEACKFIAEQTVKALLGEHTSPPEPLMVLKSDHDTEIERLRAVLIEIEAAGYYLVDGFERVLSHVPVMDLDERKARWEHALGASSDPSGAEGEQ